MNSELNRLSEVPSYHFQLQEQKASLSFNKKGKAIQEGSKTLRLVISGQDDRLGIVARRIISSDSFSLTKSFQKLGQSLTQHNYIKLEVQGETVEIHINSLSERLGISKKALRAAQKSHTLLELIGRKASQKQEIINQFKQVSQTYKKLEPNKLLKLMMLANSGQVGLSKKLKEGNIHFIATRLSKTQVNLVEREAFLGQGNYGCVEKVYDLSLNQTQVYKYPRITLSSIEKNYGVIIPIKQKAESIRKEFAVLSLIHEDPNENIIGVQEKPHVFIQIQNKNSDQVGYMMPQYDGDLEEWLQSTKEISFEAKKDATNQLLQGAQTLVNKGIVHGDLRVANILVGEGIYHIADMGGVGIAPRNLDSMTFSEIESFTENRLIGVHNPQQEIRSELEKDLKKLLSEEKEQVKHQDLTHYKVQNPKIKEILKQIIEIEHKQDVYSLGLVLKKIWGNKFEPSSELKLPKTKLSTLENTKPIPTELINKMKEVNLKDRISIEEAIDLFSKWTATQNS